MGSQWRKKIPTRQNLIFENRNYSPTNVYGSPAGDEFYQQGPSKIQKLNRQQSYNRQNEPDFYANLKSATAKTPGEKRCLRCGIVIAVFVVLWTAVALAIYYGIFRNLKTLSTVINADSYNIQLSINDSFRDNLTDLSSSDATQLKDKICTALNETFQTNNPVKNCAVIKFSPGSILCSVEIEFENAVDSKIVESVLRDDFQSDKSIFKRILKQNVTLIGVAASDTLLISPKSVATTPSLYAIDPNATNASVNGFLTSTASVAWSFTSFFNVTTTAANATPYATTTSYATFHDSSFNSTTRNSTYDVTNKTDNYFSTTPLKNITKTNDTTIFSADDLFLNRSTVAPKV